MAIRQGKREQMELLPPSIEQYIAEDAPVRVYDAFVETLDLSKLGIESDPRKEGNPSYDPKAMLKLLVYGYSYGIRSSRKLEREVYYNLSFIWLMGGLKPDHKTIAEFRRKNKEALQKTLVQCVRLCLKLDLVAGNILFVDGSKIRGNVSLKNTWDKEKCRKVLEKAERRIAEVIAEAEATDEAEADLPSLVSIKQDLEGALNLKQRVAQIMQELEQSDSKTINTVDKDSTRVNNFQGTGAGYNAQVVVDDQNGLIVSCDAVRANNDLGQFASQINQAQQVLGKPCRVAVADSGYAFTDDLGQIEAQGIRVIVPGQQVAKGRIAEYNRRRFSYDASNDCYVCPQGKVLTRRGKTDRGVLYRVAKKTDCSGCASFGRCTKAQTGRTIYRIASQQLQDRLEAEYALPQNQLIYKRRQQKVELVFGHIKRNLGVSSFLLRGREGVRAEMSMLSLCFNLRRMISLLGQNELILRLRSATTPTPITAISYA